MHKRLLRWIGILSFAGASYAQTAGTVTLNADRSSAQGSHVPVLTWSTSPVATTCAASGGWSGTKAASGTQTLPVISATTTFTLTCTWGSGSATVNWTAPTTNTNGSVLNNLARFNVVYGNSSTALTRSLLVTNPASRSVTLSGLASGTWYFAVRAVNSNGAESANSNVESKVVLGAAAARTVSIAITAATPTSGYVTVSRNVWDVYRKSNGVLARKGVVGSIALGKPCSTSYRVGAHHYLVSRADVTLTATPASTNLVVYCERR